MSEEEITFLPYEVAKKLVANVIEEEHIREPNRRILTVYDSNEKELCWFDAEEVIAAVGGSPKKRPTDQDKDEVKMAAVEYILHRIPDWVLDDE